MTAIIKKTRCPYPVGALIELTVGANPNTFWQGTTWAVHGTGRATVAIDAGQADFNALAKTGGAKSHVMTLANLIEHDHMYQKTSAGVYVGQDGSGGGNVVSITTDTTNKTGSATPDAMPTLPPYIVVARWERTA